MPPAKLVAPTLVSRVSWGLSGSMMTTGTLARSRAASCTAVSSPVMPTTASRPAAARRRAQATGGSATGSPALRGPLLTVIVRPSSTAASSTPCTTSEV